MKLYFDKKGFLLEFYKTKLYSPYLLIKTLVFLLDYLIPFLITYIFWFFVKDSFLKWFLIIILPYFVYSFYIAFSLIILKGRTIGMFFASITLTDKGGGAASNLQIWIRSIASGFYSIPIIGWLLLIINIFSCLFWKGRTLIDTISNTTTVSKKLFRKINYTKEDKDEL